MLKQQGFPTSHLVTKYEREPYGVYEEGIIVKFLMALTIFACTIAAIASVLGLYALGMSENFTSVIGFLP